MQDSPPDHAAGSAGTAPRNAVAWPLTFKALIACILLVLYGGLMAAYVLAERQTMLGRLAAIDEQQGLEEALKRAGLAVSSALLSLRQASVGDVAAEAAGDATPFALEAIERALGQWQEHVPAVMALHRQAQRRLAALSAQPSRASLLELRQALEEFGREIEREGSRARVRRDGMGQAFREHGERIALVALALGLGGLVVFGGVAAVFFARLASDLRVLGRRARDIVSGYRGEPLPVTRRDEVGSLARDVNQMAADLAVRERELALSRELRSHREKMAALGAMARSLSHEIGNPLATISAIAQEARPGRDEAAGVWQPEAILRETQRISEITRQIADFSVMRADVPEVVDARAMLNAVCDFMRFDPRFRSTRIEVRMPPDLPLLVVVPDQLSEVIMNLLQLSVDAQATTAPQSLTVEAAARREEVVIRVLGGAPSADSARRERTRGLVEGMSGRMSEDEPGRIEVALPGVAAMTV